MTPVLMAEDPKNGAGHTRLLLVKFNSNDAKPTLAAGGQKQAWRDDQCSRLSFRFNGGRGRSGQNGCLDAAVVSSVTEV